MVATPDQKNVGNGFQPIGVLVTGTCIHRGFIRKVITHRIGQIGKQGFLEFSDMIHTLVCYHEITATLRRMMYGYTKVSEKVPREE